MRATTSFSSTLDTLSIDELAFYKGDVDVASLYANRLNIEEATLPTNTVLTALWRMGDNPSDVISPVTSMSIRNNISTNDSRLVHNSTMANPSFCYTNFFR